MHSQRGATPCWRHELCLWRRNGTGSEYWASSVSRFQRGW
ncbi:peptidase inhibitor family I36 protein [Pseudomonas viridiflava]